MLEEFWSKFYALFETKWNHETAEDKILIRMLSLLKIS